MASKYAPATNISIGCAVLRAAGKFLLTPRRLNHPTQAAEKGSGRSAPLWPQLCKLLETRCAFPSRAHSKRLSVLFRNPLPTDGQLAQVVEQLAFDADIAADARAQADGRFVGAV